VVEQSAAAALFCGSEKPGAPNLKPEQFLPTTTRGPAELRSGAIVSTSESALRAGVAFAFGLSLFSLVGALGRLVPASWTRQRPPSGATQATKSLTPAKRRRRTVAGTVVGYLITGLLLWALFLGGAWTQRSVGIFRRESLVVCVIAGVIVYYALVGLYGVALQLLGRRDSERRANLRIHFGLLPRAARARCVVIAIICLANPIIEELIFRGLLVHQYAALYGNFPRALLIGAVVNAANHAYQGLRAVPFHLAVYAATVALLYSPYGLVAAIGFHYVGDAMPFLRLREQLKEYRATRRKARRARTVSA
jgi:membrane protease YdiL (CAAX protease family)